MINIFKHTHMLLAVLTVLGFSLRVYWRYVDSEMMQKKWVKIAPHVVDTMLLIFGVTLVFSYNLSVSENVWIIAKLTAIFCYIGIGFYTFKKATSRASILVGGLAGWLVLAYIFKVAFSKSIGF